MPPRRGFLTGDFDTFYPLDKKFTRLAALLPRRDYLAATGLWWELVAETWREAERVRIAADSPADLVTALRSAGLIDRWLGVPRATFDRWVGAALARRSTDAARQQRSRAARVSRVTTRVVTTGTGVAPPSNGVARAPDDGEPEAPAIAWLAGHNALVMPNGNGLHRRLMDEVDRHGVPKVIAALEKVWATGAREQGQLVLGASNFLNPIPKVGDVEKRERSEERDRARDARLARADRERRERDEWVADDDAPAHDTPRRVGHIIDRQQTAGH